MGNTAVVETLDKTRMKAKTLKGETIWFPCGEDTSYLGVVITPALATFFLDFAKDKFTNRHSNQKRVADYALAMQEGRWKLNGSSLGFDKNGVMVDGYTRCTAAF